MNTTDTIQEPKVGPTTCSAINIHLHGEAPDVLSGEGGHLWVNAGPLTIHGDRRQLIRFATSILEQLHGRTIELAPDLDPRQSEHTPFGVTGDITTVDVGDLYVGDTIAVPDWPDERWELVTRFDEFTPGYLDVHVSTGERFTWPADHAVKVRLPRPARCEGSAMPDADEQRTPAQIRGELASTAVELGGAA